jgi:hypothetical protein
MSGDYVTIRELADEFGMLKSNLRPWATRHGFSWEKIRTPETQNQLTLALPAAEAESLRALRGSQGFGVSARPIDNGHGEFYIVQLIPEVIPGRLKLGFATNAASRLVAHRTVAPTAQLLMRWTCRKSWEPAAIASLTRSGCALVANEVFDCEDVEQIRERGDAFFALMPRNGSALG